MNGFSICLNHKLLHWDTPITMGIVNVTPDSFAVHCSSCREADILACAATQVQEGAAILDIGGYSTRPHAAEVSVEEEWQRVATALKVIRSVYPDIPISLDTFRHEIAERAIAEYGEVIINDVSGGLWDSNMFPLLASSRVPYILTHTGWQDMRQTMSPRTYPDDIVAEVLHFFQERVDQLHQLGVRDIILDPGFGLGKSIEENYYLLRNMEVFHTLELPVLAGLSRKSMLFKPLHITPQDALNATTAVHMIALEHGAAILRAHDVKEAEETIQIYRLTQAS